MENNILSQIPTEALWAIVSFGLGVFVKYIFNVFVTPRIDIVSDIVPDLKTQEPYIKVRNSSFVKWNKAYDLHFYLTYYRKERNVYEPFHTGIIEDGLIKPGKSEKYAITPKDETNNVVLDGLDYKISVILIYRNRFSTYTIVEQECIPDASTIKKSVKR